MPMSLHGVDLYCHIIFKGVGGGGNNQIDKDEDQSLELH